MEVVRVVLFLPEVLEKLRNKHGLTQSQVEAVIFDRASEARWDDDPKHGGRLIVRGAPSYGGRRLYVALSPVERPAGIWSCRTAFYPDRDDYPAERQEGPR